MSPNQLIMLGPLITRRAWIYVVRTWKMRLELKSFTNPKCLWFMKVYLVLGSGSGSYNSGDRRAKNPVIFPPTGLTFPFVGVWSTRQEGGGAKRHHLEEETKAFWRFYTIVSLTALTLFLFFSHIWI